MINICTVAQCETRYSFASVLQDGENDHEHTRAHTHHKPGKRALEPYFRFRLCCQRERCFWTAAQPRCIWWRVVVSGNVIIDNATAPITCRVSSGWIPPQTSYPAAFVPLFPTPCAPLRIWKLLQVWGFNLFAVLSSEVWVWFRVETCS